MITGGDYWKRKWTGVINLHLQSTFSIYKRPFIILENKHNIFLSLFPYPYTALKLAAILPERLQTLL